MKKLLKQLTSSLLLGLAPLTSFAQGEVLVETQSGWINSMMQNEQGQILLIFAGLLLILIVLLLAMVILLAKTASLVTAEDGKKKGVSWLTKLKQKWVTGKLKPVGQDADMLLDHNYDGIQEMDYGMPPWLRYVFIGSFIFAVFYVPAFLIYDIIPDQQTEFNAQIERAALIAEARAKEGIIRITAEAAAFSSDQEVIDAGNRIYQANCAVCHAKDGGGGVGPNLTDEYWLHGADIKSIFTTVSEGVPAKGMIPWKSMLSGKEMESVSNYIISLVGTTPVAPKEPQGVLIEKDSIQEQIEEAVENPDADNPGPIEVILNEEETL